MTVGKGVAVGTVVSVGWGVTVGGVVAVGVWVGTTVGVWVGALVGVDEARTTVGLAVGSGVVRTRVMAATGDATVGGGVAVGAHALSSQPSARTTTVAALRTVDGGRVKGVSFMIPRPPV